MNKAWLKNPLSEICDVSAGGTPSRGRPDYYSGSIPWVKISDMLQGKISGTEETITEEAVQNSSAKIFPSGTILLSIFATIGRTAELLVPAATNQAIAGIIPKDGVEIDKNYLRKYLNFAAVELASKGRGVAQNNINLGILKSLEIRFPSDLDEQKRIAAILDKADGIRRKRQQALRLADDFLRSVFLDMFGDPISNPKGWNVEKSGKLFEVKPRIGTTRPAKGEGNIVVRVGELGANRIRFEACGRVALEGDELERFSLQKGDTAIARAIGSKNQLGKASYFDGYPEDVVVDSHVMRLRPDSRICNPRWFYSLLTSEQGKAMIATKGGATAVQFNINAKQASDLDIPLPPIILQNKFGEIAEVFQERRRKLVEAIDQSEDLFASLQQRAFRGEL